MQGDEEKSNFLFIQMNTQIILILDLVMNQEEEQILNRRNLNIAMILIKAI